MKYTKLILLALGSVLLFLLFTTVSPLSDLILAKTSPPPVEDLYMSCTGSSFKATCPNLVCVADGIEQRAFNTWKERFMEIYGLSERYFDDHITITDVVYGADKNDWVTITYVYHTDWVQSRQSVSLLLSSLPNYTNAEELSNASITKLVDSEINKSDQFGKEVISYNKLLSIMQTQYKNKSLNFDFCSINFQNDTGALSLTGAAEIDLDANVCAKAEVNLHTGAIDTHDDACYQYE